jgi:hypothetical protein
MLNRVPFLYLINYWLWYRNLPILEISALALELQDRLQFTYAHTSTGGLGGLNGHLAHPYSSAS